VTGPRDAEMRGDMGGAWAKLPAGRVAAAEQQGSGLRPAGLYVMVGKPLIDVVFALVLLVVLAPVLFVTIALLRIELGGGLLITQQRIGKGNVPFDMFKLRTMRPDRRHYQATSYTGPERRVSHKSAEDPRHTRVGRVVRRWSLDEVPQLVNVVRGEMSIVGPRPELAVIVDEYEPWQHSRHFVKPGVTGLWQTTLRRDSDQLMQYHTDIDLEYIRTLSLWRDLVIMAQTPFAMRFGR